MGTKRPYSAVDSQSGGPGDHSHRSQHGPSKKKQKQAKSKLGAEETSVNTMKKRARAIERLLQRRGEEKPMPANVQKDLERELAALKQRIQEAQEKKQRNAMISKYHMVRFFERKKAQRLVKKIQKKLNEANDPDEIARLKEDLHIAEVDVNYAIYFPFMERYVSLYSASAEASKETGEKAAAELALHGERPPMWRTVEAAMAQGEHALLLLQNRRPGPKLDSASHPASEKHRSQPNAREDSATSTSTAAPAAKALESKRSKHKEGGKKKSKEKTKEKPKASVKARHDSASDDSGGESDGGFFETA